VIYVRFPEINQERPGRQHDQRSREEPQQYEKLKSNWYSQKAVAA
jgi:hypothetical protein